jgi:hypothetical protein
MSTTHINPRGFGRRYFLNITNQCTRFGISGEWNKAKLLINSLWDKLEQEGANVDSVN